MLTARILGKAAIVVGVILAEQRSLIAMTKTQQRRRRAPFTAKKKLEIIRKHLVDRVSMTELGRQYGFSPSLLYYWEGILFANAAAVFEPRSDPRDQQIVSVEGKLRQVDRELRRLVRETIREKNRIWGPLAGKWVAQEVRDAIVDFVHYWSERADIPAKQLLMWIGLSQSKFYEWQDRYGQPNQHNSDVPRSSWLTDEERATILAFQAEHPDLPYRELTARMKKERLLDVSPATVYRVLREAERT
jgi:transposase-like protein/transposase